MPRSIVLASRNPGKLREIRQVLAPLEMHVVSIDDVCPEVPEPEETGATFAENAQDKAVYYSKASGLWCLADDSGLVVDALEGKPGVHSARYAADEVDGEADRKQIDQANNAKLLRELGDTPDSRRNARFVCHLALADGENVLLETTGAVEGRIGHAPAGDNGFGYDPLFILPDRGCTTAQLPSEQKNAISHRGQAVRRMADELQDLLSR